MAWRNEEEVRTWSDGKCEVHIFCATPQTHTQKKSNKMSAAFYCENKSTAHKCQKSEHLHSGLKWLKGAVQPKTHIWPLPCSSVCHPDSFGIMELDGAFQNKAEIMTWLLKVVEGLISLCGPGWRAGYLCWLNSLMSQFGPGGGSLFYDITKTICSDKQQ